MKTPKSLFQKATEKYTTLSTDLVRDRKIFLEALATPLSALDLNKLYAGKNDAGKSNKLATSTTADFSSNPGGSEDPNKNNQPTDSTDTANVAPELATISGLSDAKPIVLPNGDKITINPLTGMTVIVSKNPKNYSFAGDDDMTKLQGLAKSAKDILSRATNEDIMSALTTLSTGSVSELAPQMDEGDDDGMSTKVGPADDVLIDEDEEDGDGNDAPVDEASAEPMPSTSSDISMPTDGNSTKTSVSTGSKGSASSFMPETEKKDNLTGVDDSYTTESDSSKGAGKGDEQADPEHGPGTGISSEVSKGAGEYKQTGKVGETEPEIGENEANPSGKESAFWVPGDDLLGLKDIVSTNAKANGLPDAQTTIGKDANGSLVKKPTTPSYPTPNMRQYVRTNPTPGNPQGTPVVPMGSQQQADISDLDSVMGLDSQSDKALNISLNFNF